MHLKEKKGNVNIGPGNNNRVIPFVGTYNIKSSIKKQNPSYSFGYKSDKFALNDKREEIPGPGAYYNENLGNSERKL